LELEGGRARCEDCASDRCADGPGWDMRGAEGPMECPPPPPENPPPPRRASTEELNSMSKQRAMAVAEIAVMVRMGYPLFCAPATLPIGCCSYVESPVDAGKADHDNTHQPDNDGGGRHRCRVRHEPATPREPTQCVFSLMPPPDNPGKVEGSPNVSAASPPARAVAWFVGT